MKTTTTYQKYQGQGGKPLGAMGLLFGDLTTI